MYVAERKVRPLLMLALAASPTGNSFSTDSWLVCWLSHLGKLLAKDRSIPQHIYAWYLERHWC